MARKGETVHVFHSVALQYALWKKVFIKLFNDSYTMNDNIKTPLYIYGLSTKLLSGPPSKIGPQYGYANISWINGPLMCPF